MGKLIAIGGAEHKGTEDGDLLHRRSAKFSELGVLKRVVSESGKDQPHIEVITTASSIPDEVGQGYIDAFKRIGCLNVGHVNIRSRDDVGSKEFIDRIKICDIIMFSGGDQKRLTSIFGETEFFEVIYNRCKSSDIIIAGTSAGAMAMSKLMIYDGDSIFGFLKGEVKTTTGLGLVEDVVIDSHFNKRGRFSRLAQAVCINPVIGIGIGEDTGVIIGRDEIEVIGSGSVVIIDGSNVKDTNVHKVDNGHPISVEGLIVHILEEGNKYDYKNKKIK